MFFCDLFAQSRVYGMASVGHFHDKPPFEGRESKPKTTTRKWQVVDIV